MSYKLTDEYSDIDSFDGGFMPDEIQKELNALQEAKKEARKEVKEECRKRKVDYKFKLNKI